MTTCQHRPREPEPVATVRSLVLVILQDPTRVRAIAADLSVLVPDAVVLDGTALRTPLATADDDGRPPDVILVGADPDGWAAASVLAACRPKRLGRPVDALLVAEGPLERFTVLVTDFPGLRLLPPDAEVPAVIARLLGA